MERLARGTLGLLLTAVVSLAITPAIAKAATLGYPHHGIQCVHPPYATTGSGYWCAGYSWGTIRNNDRGESIFSARGYAYRNCTDYVAWALESLGVPSSLTRSLGNGGDWYANAASKPGLSRGTTPAVGAAAVQLPSPSNNAGHVAYVSQVHQDGKITVLEYNGALDGNGGTRTGMPGSLGFTRFVYFGPHMTSPPANGGGSVDSDADGVSDPNDQCPNVPGVPAYNGCPPPARLVVVRTGTALHGKSETLTSPWVWGFNATPAADVRVVKERTIYTTPDGNLWAKDKIDGQWVNPGVVTQFAVSESMLVLRVGNTLHAKPGLLNDGSYPWFWAFNNQPATDVKVAGNRIAYRSTAGEIWVRDSINLPWLNVGYAEEFAISESTIALRSGGNLHAKSGLLAEPTPWYYSFGPVGAQPSSLMVAGSRIAFRATSGDVWVRDSLNNPWVNLGIRTQYVITPDMVLLRNANTLSVKLGLVTDTTPGWLTNIGNEGAVDIWAAGKRIAYKAMNGQVWARESVNHPWINFGYVDQFAMS